MPIVINEIEINVQVASDNPQSAPSGGSVNASSKEAIIKECVEKVMEIINLKNER